MKKALSILLALTLLLSLTVTALADGTKTVTYNGNTDFGNKACTVSVTMPADTADGTFHMSPFDEEGTPMFTVPTGTTVEINVAHEDSFEWLFSLYELVLDENVAFPEYTLDFDIHNLDLVSKASGTSVFLEMNDSGYYTPGFTFLDDEFEYGDPGPSLFCIIHVVDDTIPAADVRKVTPPSGDNVVKLTGTGEGKEYYYYQGDLYLEFSQLLKAVPADEDLYPDCMEYHIPAGSTVTFYRYFNGELNRLTYYDVSYEGYFSNVDDDGYEYLDSTYPEEKLNDDGSITMTFEDPAYYYYGGDVAVDPTPFIFVESAASSDTPTTPAPITPPTGDNVVKLTGTLDDDMSQGDLYLEFSQLTKAVPVDSDGMEYHIPVGSSVTVYWYYNGEFQSLDPDTGGGIVLFDFVDAQYQYTFPEDKVNDDGTITLTFTEPGIYKNDSVDFQGAYWQVSPEPTIVVESAVSDPTPTPTTPTFTDVPNWCAEAAEYMAEHKLMNGTGENRFSPNETTTRGMLMTILARADGEDTAGDPWYKAGMEWCVGAKVSDGTKPEATVTRQEIATMLWRYFDEPACDKTPDFPDASSVDSWAVTAVNWCVYNGIITGKDGSLDPTGLATRAEAATTVYRAITQAAA